MSDTEPQGLVPTSIVSLPPELHINILNRLGWDDQVIASQTNRLWHEILNQKSFLKQRYTPQYSIYEYIDSNYVHSQIPYIHLHGFLSESILGPYPYDGSVNSPALRIFRTKSENSELLVGIADNIPIESSHYGDNIHESKIDRSKLQYRSLPSGILNDRIFHGTNYLLVCVKYNVGRRPTLYRYLGFTELESRNKLGHLLEDIGKCAYQILGQRKFEDGYLIRILYCTDCFDLTNGRGLGLELMFDVYGIEEKGR